jgi:hypothetical protein
MEVAVSALNQSVELFCVAKHSVKSGGLVL